MRLAHNGNNDPFMSEMGRIPLLTAAEEITLGSAVQLARSPKATLSQQRAGRRAKDRMIQANLRLVVAVSRKYLHRQIGQLELGDLVQEGCIGLNRAVEKFNPELGYKFSTYAYWWIRQSISRAIDQTATTIRTPTSMNLMLVKLGHLPSGLDDQQICKRLEVSELQLRNLRNALIAKRTMSLDMQLGNDGDASSLGVIVPDESTTLGVDQFQWDEVRDILEVQEQTDINNDFYLLHRNVVEGESLQSLAEEIGRSRERIRQRVKTAKERLAARLITHRELVG